MGGGAHLPMPDPAAPRVEVIDDIGVKAYAMPHCIARHRNARPETKQMNGRLVQLTGRMVQGDPLER